MEADSGVYLYPKHVKYCYLYCVSISLLVSFKFPDPQRAYSLYCSTYTNHRMSQKDTIMSFLGLKNIAKN